MVSMGILEINGFSFDSTYGRINLSWWPIVSCTCSIIMLLFGSLWIYEPVSSETNKWIGFFTFLPIFFFRLFSWQMIILTMVELSLCVIATILFTNIVILYAVQSRQLLIEPLSSAVLSIVLPMYKLPSTRAEKSVSIKALTLLVTCGNTILILTLGLICALQSYNVYNPWDSNKNWPIKFRAEWFYPAFWTLLSLFMAATVPSMLVYFSTVKKFVSMIANLR
jgi:hypothetical protein